MKKLFFLALLAFALPMSTWADNEVGDEGTDDEQEVGGQITPSSVSFTYIITKVATGTTLETAGEVELEGIASYTSGANLTISIPHYIHNFVLNDGTVEVYYYNVVGIKNATTINNGAFFLNTDLTSVTLPYTMTYVGDWAFANCSNLEEVNIVDTDDNPSELTSIGDDAFYCANGSSLATINLPRSLTSIGAQAFQNSKLTSIELPEGFTTLGNSAFNACTSLVTAVLPQTLINISQSAFQGCSALTTVTMSGSAQLLSDAFQNCTSLSSIILLGDEPATSGGTETGNGTSDPFYGDGGETITLYVPTGSAPAYLQTNWANDVASDTNENLVWNFNSISVSSGAYDAEADDTNMVYGTYYTDAVGEFGDDITANIVTSVAEIGTITYQAVSGVIPAGTGLLLSASSYDALNSGSTYYYHPYGVTADEATTISNNMLYGTSEEAMITTPSNCVYYKLSLDSGNTAGTVGFYWGAEDGAAFTNGAGKAYLAVPTSSGASLRKLSFEDNGTTGITEVEAVANPAVEGIYTLQGVRVSDMSKKGVYIVNGKKVLVK